MGSIIKSKEWKEIKDIIKGTLGTDHCIAGGYARDLFYGCEPKDMDVGVFNAEAIDILDILGLLETEDLIVKSYIDDAELFAAHYEGNHIAGVVTCKGGIDLIFCNELVTSTQEWINTFDYNLNQFTLVETGKIEADEGFHLCETKYTDGDIIIFTGADYGTLTFHNSNTNRLNKAVQRRDKMLELAPKYGWSISQEVQEMDVELEILKFSAKSDS